MAPDLHGDDPEQCVGVGPASGSRDESDGLVPGVEDVAPIFMDETDLFALSPVVPVSREAEQYLELSPDEVSRESDEAAPVSANPCSQEDVADTQAPAQEPEQRCDEARNSVDELIASFFEDSADTQARDPQLSGDPPRQRRRISPEVENLVEDTAPFPDCDEDDPQFGA